MTVDRYAEIAAFLDRFSHGIYFGRPNVWDVDGCSVVIRYGEILYRYSEKGSDTACTFEEFLEKITEDSKKLFLFNLDLFR